MNLRSKAGIAPLLIIIAITIMLAGAAGTAKVLQQKQNHSTTQPSQTITLPTTQSGTDTPSTSGTKVIITPFITPPSAVSLPCQYASFLPGCSTQIQQWQQYQLQQQQIQQQYLQYQQQLNQQKQYTNPMANPQINPQANPQINPNANPQINPYANPQINPYANPQINPNYVPGQYTPQNPPGGYH